MREAAAWLTARGEPLWSPDEIADADIAARAASGELVIGWRGGEACACMYLQQEDRPYWPDAVPGSAYYVHRLAVRRAEAGQGWSRRLLDWAADKAHRDNRNFLRLDTELRPRLLQHYETCGFVRYDREPIQVGPHLVVRFERRTCI
jgi:GNAT superfamily N-acetyltransferase